MGKLEKILKSTTAYVLVFVMAFSLLFTGNNTITVNAASPVTKMTVKKSKVTIDLNKSKTAKVKVTVKGGNKKFTAKSNKKAVATVKVSGKNVVITGKKAGTAKITVTTKGKNKKGKKLSKKITVTVKGKTTTTEDEAAKKASEEADKKAAEEESKKAAEEAAKKAAEEAAKKAADEKAVADKVAADSVITSLDALPEATKVSTTDEETITGARKAYDALTADQKALVSADVLKKLTDAEDALAEAKEAIKPAPQVNAVEIKLSLSANETAVGGIVTATATVLPDDATNKAVTYSVEDTSYATVDADTGEIKALKEGTAIIKATANDGSGVTATQKLIINGTASIVLQKQSLSGPKGYKGTLSYSTSPANSTVEFTSSDETKVKINKSTGAFEALEVGQAEITAKLTDFPDAEVAQCVIVVISDEVVRITGFNGLSQDGTIRVSVSMTDSTHKVTEEQLIGTTVSIKNKDTNKTLTAQYVEGSLSEDATTAAYYVEKSQLISGTYALVSNDGKVAVVTDSADDLTQSVTKTTLTTGIAGMVYDDAINGDPVFGAEVKVMAGTSEVQKTTTDVYGHYEMEVAEGTGYYIVASKKDFYETNIGNTYNSEKISVKIGKVTTANIIMDDIVVDERALYGYVTLAGDTQIADLIQKPVATLYKNTGGEDWKEIASTVVGNNGYYAFMNAYSNIAYNDDYKNNEGFFFRYDYTTRSRNYDVIYSSADYIGPDIPYKIVISDGLSADNQTNVYNTVEIPYTYTNKKAVDKVEDVTLYNVASFQGLSIDKGDISWNSDVKPQEGTEKVKLNYTLFASDNSFIASGDFDVNYDDYTMASKDKTTIIDKDILSLPADTYYLTISYGNGTADIYTSIETDEAGKAAKIKNVEFKKSEDFNILMGIDVTGTAFKGDNALEPESSVTLKDLYGEVLDGEIYLNASVYRIDENNKEVLIYNDVPIENFVVAENAKSVNAVLPLDSLVTGNTYRVRFNSSVLSVTNKEGTPTVNAKEGCYTFEYDASSDKSATIIMFTDQANVEFIKFLSREAQFGNAIDPTHNLMITRVALENEEGTVVNSIDINDYFSCENWDKITSNIEKDQVLYGGGDLVDGDGINVDFKNITPGKYKFVISINGYEKKEIPLSFEKLVGLSKGTYTLTENDKFDLIPETNIYGTITDSGVNGLLKNVNVSITVLDDKGIVVATGSTSDGNYIVANNSKEEGNVLIKGKKYTLVFRGDGYQLATVTTDELKEKGNNYPISLVQGAGTIEANIYSENNQPLLSSALALALDSWYVEDEGKFVNDTIRKLYYDGIGFNNGAYRMSKTNKTVWNTVGSVPVGEYYILTGGGENYKIVKEYGGKIPYEGAKLVCPKDIFVPLAEDDLTTPVTVKVVKTNPVDNNKGGIDILRIYKKNDDGTTTFVTQLVKYTNWLDNPLNYNFEPYRLNPGKYVGYVYSKNYQRGELEITVETTPQAIQEESVSLLSVKN